MRGGVLPAAQFCNTLTHDVLQLWRARAVRPYVVHATWMRQQAEATTPPPPRAPRLQPRAPSLQPRAPSLRARASQAEAFKLMRLREARLWRDAPAWYSRRLVRVRVRARVRVRVTNPSPSPSPNR